MGRGVLLARNVFPLARAELPSQLSRVGKRGLGHALERAIHERLTLPELTAHLGVLHEELGGERAFTLPAHFPRLDSEAKR